MSPETNPTYFLKNTEWKNSKFTSFRKMPPRVNFTEPQRAFIVETYLNNPQERSINVLIKRQWSTYFKISLQFYMDHPLCIKLWPAILYVSMYFSFHIKNQAHLKDWLLSILLPKDIWSFRRFLLGILFSARVRLLGIELNNY